MTRRSLNGTGFFTMGALLLATMTAGAHERPWTTPAVERDHGSATYRRTSPEYRGLREVTIAAGTPLHLRLDQAVGSEFSRVEDRVRARLSQPIVVDGRTVVPAGSLVEGVVTDAVESARVKGRARLSLRFHSLTLVRTDDRYRIATRTWAREAEGTKKKDAATIGAPAVGGAIIGGLIDGKKGAGIGALIGGGAGTAVVLSTRGEEITLGRGALIVVRLARPLVIDTPERW